MYVLYFDSRILCNYSRQSSCLTILQGGLFLDPVDGPQHDLAAMHCKTRLCFIYYFSISFFFSCWSFFWLLGILSYSGEMEFELLHYFMPMKLQHSISTNHKTADWLRLAEKVQNFTTVCSRPGAYLNGLDFSVLYKKEGSTCAQGYLTKMTDNKHLKPNSCQ